jgi:polar amino acid transport system substrate-binding protein
MKQLLFLIFSLQYLFAQGMTILTEENPPWNYTQNGKLQGISVEIVKHIQKELGTDYAVSVTPWNRGYGATLKHDNHILFSTAKIASRDDLFQWVGPIATDKVYLFEYVQNPQNVKTLSEAKKVAAIDAGPPTNAAYMVLQSKGFTNLSHLSRDIGDINHLVNAKVSLLALGENSLAYKAFLENIDISKFVNTGVLIYEYPLYIAFSKTTDSLVVAKWQAALDKLKSSGVVAKIIDNELKKLQKR